MANITLLGASYTDVPAVDIPKTGGGTVRFYENGGAPSQTQHTIYFEFSDSTTETITGYWDSQFISNAILATTPSTYGQKTVDSVSLDGVEWYTRPTESWEVIYNDNVGFFPEENPNDYPYCWISSLADVEIPTDSVWRVTFDGVTYRLVGKYDQSMNAGYIGNLKYSNGHPDDGSGVPFYFWHTAWGAWSGGADVESDSSHAVIIERLVTA